MKENIFCSCCLSEECYKDMANVYYFGKRKENYFEMLASIFNIYIHKNDAVRCLICEECVSRLRDAARFKKLILNTQEAIDKELSRLKTDEKDDNKSTILSEIEVDDEFDDFEDCLSDSFNDEDFVWNNTAQFTGKDKLFIIKLQPTEDKTSSKSIEKPEITEETKMINELLNMNENIELNINNTETENIKYGDNFDVRTDDGIQDGDNGIQDGDDAAIDCGNKSAGKRPAKKVVKKKKTVKDAKSKSKQITKVPETFEPPRENTIKLIQNSNLCLFTSLQHKLGCVVCKEAFFEMPKLREHTNTHTKLNVIRRVRRLRGLSYKNADITELKCSICDTPCADLAKLLSHLQDNHEISFSGSDHFLIPYKIHDGWRCVLCNAEFNNYFRLSIHMNSHYTHNVCEKCGQSFINRLGLRMHIQSMHREKKCRICPATLSTNSDKVKHLRKVHNICNSKRYCTICNQTFRHTYMLENHKVEKHGAQRITTSCPECGKILLNACSLKMHLRSVHMKERNHPCTVCGMSFFTSTDRKRHERTHENVRSFSCSYCESKFKSKDSWRRHLRRQHGHTF